MRVKPLSAPFSARSSSGRLRSRRASVTRGRSASNDRSGRPREKSSTSVTSSPRATSARATWRPRKPAPPVTSTRSGTRGLERSATAELEILDPGDRRRTVAVHPPGVIEDGGTPEGRGQTLNVVPLVRRVVVEQKHGVGIDEAGGEVDGLDSERRQGLRREREVVTAEAADRAAQHSEDRRRG